MKKGIQKIYTEVAPTYELANHVLTFGLDIIWRKRAAREAKRLGGKRWMDICSGTGELARNMAALATSAGDKLELHVVDGSLSMILLAKNKKHMHKVKFTLADAGHLPFPDKNFDLIAISFATRNLNPNPETLLLYLKEFFRVLKPSGNFLNLETSQPPLAVLRRLYHLYIRLIVRPVGYIISGSNAGYKYLSYTMPRFYDAQGFSSLCFKAGFKKIRSRLLFMGVAAIHIAKKSA